MAAKTAVLMIDLDLTDASESVISVLLSCIE